LGIGCPSWFPLPGWVCAKQSKGEVFADISVCHFAVTSNVPRLQRSHTLDLVRHGTGFMCICMCTDSWVKLFSSTSSNQGRFFASPGSLGAYSELQILMTLFLYCETFGHEPWHQEECLSGTEGARLSKHTEVWDVLRLLHVVQSPHV